MSIEVTRLAVARRLLEWTAELVLVFIGVYGAFWLNSHQEHLRDAQRRDVILAALEQDVHDATDNARAQTAHETAAAATFRRRLEAGEMPTVRPFIFETDYSPTDVATLMQAGGVELLDVKTLTALRNVESTLRVGLAATARFARLSDEMIVPNLDQDSSFFYDPATKKLRKRFEDYPKEIEYTATFFRDVEKAESDLLDQIKVERKNVNVER